MPSCKILKAKIGKAKNKKSRGRALGAFAKAKCSRKGRKGRKSKRTRSTRRTRIIRFGKSGTTTIISKGKKGSMTHLPTLNEIEPATNEPINQ